MSLRERAAMAEEGAGADVMEIIGAGLPPLPLLVKDVTIETTISSDGTLIIYTVRVENNSGEPLGRLRVSPSVPPRMFSLDEPFRTLPPIDSGASQSATFVLRPLEEAWHLGVEGRALAGKDVSVRTVLRCVSGRATYSLEVQNIRNYSIRKLRVHPVLPEEYVSLQEFQEIEALGPNERRSIEFPVITRDEWELLQQHERGLLKPFYFSPEKPRRKRRGYPRTHTADEMTALRKTLMLAESDEEILEHIGKEPVPEDAIEDSLVIDIEDFEEEPPLEEPLESYVEPVIEEDALEEEPIILGIRLEEISEEEAVEEEPDLTYELPMEEVSEELPWEEDIDHEVVKIVKPLGPAGARAEDIETEDLEMDL
ncbi:MAG: hypothetical protein ACUVV6_05165 [Thermoplasmatota archaeon]